MSLNQRPISRPLARMAARARGMALDSQWEMMRQVIVHKAALLAYETLGQIHAIASPRPGTAGMIAALTREGLPRGKRAVLFVPTLVAGGAEQIDLALLRNMTAAGWSVVVCVETNRGAQWRERFGEATASVIVLDEWVGAPERVATARQLLSAWRPHAAIVRHSRIGYAVTPAAKKQGCATADIIHTVTRFGDWIDDAAPFAGWLDLRFATTLGVRAALETRGGATRQQILHAPNGVDISNLPSLSELNLLGAATRASLGLGDRPVIGFLGRLSAEKDLERWLLIARRILSLRSEARFVIVGDGPCLKQIKRRARRLQLDSVIRIVGACEDPFAYYGAFDLFMLTSIYEGLPMSVIEALSCGVPVLTTAVGDLPSLVSDPLGIVMQDHQSDEEFAITSLQLIDKKIDDPILSERIRADAILRLGRDAISSAIVAALDGFASSATREEDSA